MLYGNLNYSLIGRSRNEWGWLIKTGNVRSVVSHLCPTRYSLYSFALQAIKGGWRPENEAMLQYALTHITKQNTQG